MLAVLIHGLTNDSSTWFRVRPALEERGYRVVTPDLPGHGRSPHQETYSLGDFVASVVDACDETPDLAIGHSLGGFVLAHALPTLKPAHVVFEDPALALTGSPELLESFRIQATFTVDDVGAMFPAWPREAVEKKWGALQKWDTAVLDHLGSFAAPVLEPARVPSLFVLAEGSVLVPPAKQDELRSLGYRVEEIPKAGHIVHTDEFGAFVAAVDSLIA